MRVLAEWIYGIAAVLLLGTLALQAVPDGTFRRYVRLFVGVLLLLTVISPVFSALGLSRQTSLAYQRELFSVSLGNTGTIGSETDEWKNQAQKKRAEALKGPLTVLCADYGFELVACDSRWDESGSAVEALTLTVREVSEETPDGGGTGSQGIAQVESVEPVERESHYYEPSELRPLHEAVQTVLELEEKQVTIYLKRE